MVGTRRLTLLTGRIQGLLRLPEHRRVAIALSGGADSAALAYLMSRSDREVRGIHVDHGLPASPQLRQAALAVGTELSIPVAVAKAEVAAGASPEGQARAARYRAFLDSSRAGEAVLVAHTLDDQAETVMMNLLRGAGPRGLAGIPWFRPTNIFRPLLGVTRSETRELAALAGLPFLDDPMNDDPALTRGTMRREVLPGLSRFNVRLNAALARMAESIGDDSRYLDHIAGQVQVEGEGEHVAVAVGDLTSVDRAIANRVLARMAAGFREHPSLSTAELTRVWRVVSGESPVEELADGLRATRTGPSLVLSRAAGHLEVDDWVHLGPGRQRLGRIVFEIDLVDDVCRVAPLGTSRAIFDPAATLVAHHDDSGRVVVEADGAVAWVPWVQRHPVAWYQPGSTGYLSVSATEESGWTSSR